MNTTAAGAERHTFRDATRVLSSVLGPAEKRALMWLAVRMPARVNSDHLTGLALIAMIGAGLSYWLASVSAIGLLLAIVCLAVNWFGDSLDGTLARVRHQQRPRYGYYVDHVVDGFGALFLFGGMALSGYMSPFIALGILVAYLLVSIEIYLAAHSLGQFRITSLQMGPTELRIVLAIGNMVLLVHPNSVIFGQTYRLFDVGGIVAIAGLIVTLIVTAMKNTWTLYRAEPIPVRVSGRRH